MVRFAFYVRGVVVGCAVLWESVRCEYVRGVVVRALCSALWECFAVRVVRIICQRNCCTIGPNWERASYSRLSQQWIYSSNWSSALSFFVGLIIYQRFLKSIGTAWHWSEWKSIVSRVLKHVASSSSRVRNLFRGQTKKLEDAGSEASEQLEVLRIPLWHAEVVPWQRQGDHQHHYCFADMQYTLIVIIIIILQIYNIHWSSSLSYGSRHWSFPDQLWVQQGRRQLWRSQKKRTWRLLQESGQADESCSLQVG